MMRFLDYAVPYTATNMKDLKGRNRQYDRHSQHISIAWSTKIGHHVPFLLKLPSYTTWFSRLPARPHFMKYQKGTPGLFNRLYFFPDGFEEQEEMKVPHVISYGQRKDLTETFLAAEKYELLRYMDEHVFDNLDFNRHRYIDLKLEPADFRNSDELLQKSKFSSS